MFILYSQLLKRTVNVNERLSETEKNGRPPFDIIHKNNLTKTNVERRGDI